MEKPESRKFNYNFDPVSLNMSSEAILSTNGRILRANTKHELTALVHEAVGISSILKLKYSFFEKLWACFTKDEQMVKKIINADEINDQQQEENLLLLRMSRKRKHK